MFFFSPPTKTFQQLWLTIPRQVAGPVQQDLINYYSVGMKQTLSNGKFLGYTRLQKLKDTIDAGEDVDIDEENNAEAYAELIQFLDEKSLSLVIRC